MKRRSSASKLLWTIVGLLGFGLLLYLVAFLPASYVYIKYDSWGLRKSGVNNQVSTSTVYGPGKYYWGPSTSALTFPRGWQLLDYTGENQLSIATSDGLSLYMTCLIYYRIPKTSITTVFQNYGNSYSGIYFSIAREAIKNVAPKFNLSQYITARRTIEQAMGINLQAAMAAVGVEVDAATTKFLIQNITVPDNILSEFLDKILAQENVLQGLANEQIVVINTSTQVLMNEINANATLVSQIATFEAATTISEATNTATAMVQDAYTAGLNYTMTKLGITHPTDVQTFFQLLSILDGQNAKLLVNTPNTIIS